MCLVPDDRIDEQPERDEQFEQDLAALYRRQLRDDWLSTLYAYALAALPSAAVPCRHSPRACLDGSCLPCATRRVVAEMESYERGAA